MNTRKKVYTFWCPVCKKRFTTDDFSGEPCCTGPSEMRHDHDLAVMRLEFVNTVQVAPAYAEVRAAGPLIIAR